MQRIAIIGFLSVAVISTLIPTHLFSQQLALKTYDRSSGLPSNFVLSTFQDKEGFIWFATDRGVCRYDGNSYTIFTTQHGLPDNFIQFITQDHDGFLWFGVFEHGVVRFGGTRFETITLSENPVENTVNWIAQDDFGRMYFRADEHLSVFRNNKFGARIHIGNGENKTVLYKGNLYYANLDTIFRVEPTDDMELRCRKIGRVPYRNIINIGTFDTDSHVWDNARFYVGNYGGVTVLKFLDDTTLSVVNNYPVSNNVGAITHEGDSVLWCGTLSNGVVKITPNEITHYGTRHGLLQQRVETLMRDYEGNIWISSFGSGVQKLSPSSAVLYNQTDGLPNNYVSALFEDSEKRLWLGTSSGIAVLEGDSLLPLNKNRNKLKEIRSIAQDTEGNYYIGTFEYLIGPASYKQLITGDTLKHNRIGYGVSGIYLPLNSKRISGTYPALMVGTFGGGITYFHDRDSIAFRGGGEICSNVIEDVIATGSSAWFISRNGGASRYNEGKFQRYSTSDGLPSNAFYSVFEDSLRGQIWIGTDAGLSLIQQGRVHTFSSNEGILGMPVLGIFKRSGQLTKSGDELLFLTPKALHRVHNNTIEVVSTFSFAQESNLSINDFYYSPSTDVLWLATIQGAYKISLSAFQSGVTAPKVSIISVTVDTSVVFTRSPGAIRNNTPIIELLYNQGNLSLGYAGLSFINEADVRFQYKLEPLDNEWSPHTRDAHIQVRNLSDGTYRFLVKAINGDGVSSLEPAVFEFKILPPFWKRWWFLSFSGILFLGSIAGSIRYISQRKLRKQLQELERMHALQIERERISRDLHDNVGAQLVTIISGLELAGRYSEAKQQEAKTMLDSLKEDARTTMGMLRETIWALQSSEMTMEKFSYELDQYVRKQLKYHPGIHHHIEVESSRTCVLRPVEAINILRIVQESLSNCLKHATPSKIELLLSVTLGNTFTLRIINDGCEKERMADISGGKGLPNMERRAREIGGTFQFVREGASKARIELSIPLKEKRI